MVTHALLRLIFLLGFIAIVSCLNCPRSRQECAKTGTPPTAPVISPGVKGKSLHGSRSVKKPSCGGVNRRKRIVEGVQSEIYEYPWMVGLMFSFAPERWGMCGGTIIHEKFVLTAAHCVQGDLASDVAVVVGEHDWESSSTDDVRELITIAEIIIHEDYVSADKGNDIALLKLSKALTFGSYNKIAPICPPEPGNLYSNVNATVTGWGTTESGGLGSSILLEVTMPTMANSLCQDAYEHETITDDMICAGLPEGGKDSCQGDSGGPMITRDATHSTFYRLIGVVSWGYGCAQPGLPGIYARVTSHLKWINSKMGEYSWSSPGDASGPDKPSTDPFECPSAGIFPDPSDSTKFFHCMELSSSYKAYSIPCPDGLFYNPDIKTCDWPKMGPSNILSHGHMSDEL